MPCTCLFLVSNLEPVQGEAWTSFHSHTFQPEFQDGSGREYACHTHAWQHRYSHVFSGKKNTGRFCSLTPFSENPQNTARGKMVYGRHLTCLNAPQVWKKLPLSTGVGRIYTCGKDFSLVFSLFRYFILYLLPNNASFLT
jgi:hypothetical protein